MSSGPGSTTVQIAARVVAAGLEYRDNQWKVLASISLLPVPSEESNIRLRDWPKKVEALVENGCDLLINLIDMHENVEALTPFEEQTIKLRVQRQFKRDKRFVTFSNDLWARIFEIDDWSILAETLNKSRAGGRLDDVQRAQKEKKSDLAPDVFSLPRSDAALLYGFERAREVLRVVGDQRALCQVGSCRINTGGRTVDPTRFTFMNKPWLGLNEPLIRLAQATASDVSLAATGLKGNEQQNFYLSMERRTQESIYRRQLEDKAKAADSQARARHQFLIAKVRDKVAAMRDHARVRATSLPPSACADACGLATADSIAEKLTDKVKSIHGFGGLPDVDEFGDPIFDPCNRTEGAWEAAVRLTGERFHAIQSMPSLARLFNLVVDVQCGLAEFEHVLEKNSATSKSAIDPGAIDHFATNCEDSLEPRVGEAVYMFLAAAPPNVNVDASKDVYKTVWTLAKFRRANSTSKLPGEAGHFWPCTMEEVVARLHEQTSQAEKLDAAYLRNLSGIFQYDGGGTGAIAAPKSGKLRR